MEYTVDNGHTNLKAPVDLSATFRSNCRLMHGNTGAREVKGEFRNRATKFGTRLCLRRTHASSRGCGNTYGGEHCGAHDGARAPKHWPLAHHLDAILRAQDDPTRSGGALNLRFSCTSVRVRPSACRRHSTLLRHANLRATWDRPNSKRASRLPGRVRHGVN